MKHMACNKIQGILFIRCCCWNSWRLTIGYRGNTRSRKQIPKHQERSFREPQMCLSLPTQRCLLGACGRDGFVVRCPYLHRSPGTVDLDNEASAFLRPSSL